MTEDIKTPTQTSGPIEKEAPKEDTANIKQEPGKTFTQAELDVIVKDRLDRQNKKYADYKDLQVAAEKLKNLEATKLTDEERAKAKLADLEKAIKEKDAILLARELKDKKRSALETANLGLTEGWTLSDILDLMPGDEESIHQEIEKWKKRFPAKKSLGTGTQTGGQDLKNLTLDEQIAGLSAAMRDPKLSRREKQELAKKSASLQTKRLLEANKPIEVKLNYG
jgi:hypothetical protein